MHTFICKHYEAILKKSSIIHLDQGPRNLTAPQPYCLAHFHSSSTNGAFLNKESNLVLLEPAPHQFLLSSFLPKREVNLLWVYSVNYSAKFTTTPADTFLLFLWIPTFPVTSSGQHTSKCFSIAKETTPLAR